MVYGVTSAFYMYLAAPVLINAWFKKSAGLAISITAATLSILAAVASPIGQELINQFGWQTARAALSIVTTVLSVVLTVAFVRKSPRSWACFRSARASKTIAPTSPQPRA